MRASRSLSMVRSFRFGRFSRPAQTTRDASAAFTAGGARNAPSTSTEAIVCSANFGDTSAAIVARPSTRICTVCRALCSSSSCARVKWALPITSVRRAALCSTDGRARGELGADRGTNEVGAVGVEAFLHQQIDLPQVDEAQIDRDLLGLLYLSHLTIRAPSQRHLPTI